jgi:hypothetical protein
MQVGKYKIRPFVVTVQEMPEKEAFIRRHFEQAGIEVESFNGIHGDTSGLRTVHPYELDAPGSGWNMGVKPVATWLSFYMLWGALSLLPDDYFLTLEWDCQFPTNWGERIGRAMEDVPPDFDVLMLGSCCAEGRPTKHIKGEVYEVKYPLCGHASIISKKAVKTFLRTQRKVYAPLDISLTLHSFPELRVFCLKPRLCEQFNTLIPP